MEGTVGVIALSGLITSNVTAEIVHQAMMDLVEKKATRILFRLQNCFGGSVFEGNLISAHIRNLSIPVDAQVAGACASMGSILLASCEKREVDPMSFVITHRPSGAVEGCYESMSASSENLRKVYDEMCKVYAEISGTTPEEAGKTFMPFAKDVYWTADECLKNGLATGVWNSGIKAAVPMDVIQRSDLKAVAAFYEKQLNINSEPIQMDQSKVAAAIGMAGEADENKILAAVSKLSQDKKDLEAKVTDMETAAKLASEKVAKDFVAAALKDKKITAAEQPHFEKMAIADLESVKAIIDQRKPYVAIGEKLSTDGNLDPWGRKPGETDGKFFMRLYKEDSKTLERMQAENPDLFNTLKAAGAKEVK